MSAKLIRYYQDKNSGELHATPPKGKYPIGKSMTSCDRDADICSLFVSKSLPTIS